VSRRPVTGAVVLELGILGLGPIGCAITGNEMALIGAAEVSCRSVCIAIFLNVGGYQMDEPTGLEAGKTEKSTKERASIHYVRDTDLGRLTPS